MRKLRYKMSFNPLIKYMSAGIGDYSGISTVRREVPVIVSLTSTEKHFKDLELSLYSLLNQSVQPDRIILWLSDEYELSELPYSITRYIKNGLEIRFVENKGEYNKIIYPLKEFNNAINVAAKDDIIYPKKWLKRLYHSYITNPEDIHTHKALAVKVEDSNVSSVEFWEDVKKEKAEFSNFMISESGVLFPPKCFVKEIFREDLFLKNVPDSVDIWLWFMSLVSGKKVRVVKNHIETLTCTNIFRKMFFIGTKKEIQKNNEQIKSLMTYYKQNIMQKLKYLNGK